MLRSQGEYLNLLEGAIISPEDVNMHLIGQSEFYIKEYGGFVSRLDELQQSTLKDLTNLESVRRKNKKNHKNIASLEEQKVKIQNERKQIIDCINKWEKYNPSMHTEKISELDFDNKCYAFLNENKEYLPSGYKILKVKTNNIFWYEYANIIESEPREEKVIVKEATTKWVKKSNVRGQKVNDTNGSVWCLVDVPAKYQTVIHEPEKMCPKGFEFDDYQNRCSRQVKLEHALVDEDDQLKIIDLETNNEITFYNYREVTCN